MLTSLDNGVQTESDAVDSVDSLDIVDIVDPLGPEWRVLHHLVAPDGSGDRDLLLVGPPGVVALTARRRTGATVWVGSRSVTVDGQQTVLVQNARSHALRSAGLLAAALGHRIEVVPAVVFVGLAGFNVRHMAVDVQVTTDRRLRGWLTSLPVRLEADEIEAIASASARIAR